MHGIINRSVIVIDSVLNIPPFSGAHHIKWSQIKVSLFVIVGVTYSKTIIGTKGWHHYFFKWMRELLSTLLKWSQFRAYLKQSNRLRLSFHGSHIRPGFLTSPSLL
jgi:hypothetical protein